MNIISMNPMGRCDARIDALRAELGGIFADRILEAEAADFLWDSRVLEHYLGQHIDAIPDDETIVEDVSRVAVLSLMDGEGRDCGTGEVRREDGKGSASALPPRSSAPAWIGLRMEQGARVRNCSWKRSKLG